MNASVANAARLVLFAFGAALLVLGILIWSGAHELIGLHERIGIALVLWLWVIAILAGRGGVAPAIVAVALVWGLGALAFGLVHDDVVPGEWHWAIQVVHVTVSMGAIGVGQLLVSLTRRTQGAPRNAMG